MSIRGPIVIGREELIKKASLYMFILIIGIGISIWTVWYLSFSNERVVNTKVLGIERIEKVSGDKETGIFTEISYLVHTQDRTMRVSLSGLNAYPEAIGILKEGNEYTLRVRGAEIRFLGVYSSIIGVENKINYESK